MLPPLAHWVMSRDICGVTTGVLLALSGWGPGRLFNTPQCLGQAPEENDLACMSAKTEKPHTKIKF